MNVFVMNWSIYHKNILPKFALQFTFEMTFVDIP